jgi:hypothetical protein
MKKVFLIFGISFCSLLCSCIEHEYKEVGENRIEVLKPNLDVDIRYVEFDDHEYTYLRSGYGESLCHSPKCKCLTEYKK